MIINQSCEFIPEDITRQNNDIFYVLLVDFHMLKTLTMFPVFVKRY